SGATVESAIRATADLKAEARRIGSLLRISSRDERSRGNSALRCRLGPLVSTGSGAKLRRERGIQRRERNPSKERGIGTKKPLEGQRALVTGASSGIGAAIAKAMGAAGAQVVVNYVTGPDAAAAVVGEIVANGGQAVAAKADVSNEAEVVAMFDAARQAFGG